MLWIAGALAPTGRAHAALAGRAGDRLRRRRCVALLGARAAARRRPTAWDVESAHFAERFQLFVIIALGESIVVTGATASRRSSSTLARLAAFAVAFLGTRGALVAVLQLRRAAIAERRLELPTTARRLARDAYTYLHVVIVAGIIVSAVGDEIVIAHPGERAAERPSSSRSSPARRSTCSAMSLFRLRMAGTVSGKRLAARGRDRASADCSARAAGARRWPR